MRLDVSIFAIPKSVIFTVPSGVMMMFAGFTSRWTIPCAVRVVEGLRDLRDDLRDPVVGEPLLLPNDLLEVLPLDVLHGDEGRLFFLADVVDRDDVGVRERAGGLCLAQETLVELALLDVVLRRDADRLQRDEATDDGVPAQVDDAHRALAQLANHLVAAEAPGQVRVGRPQVRRHDTLPCDPDIRNPRRIRRKILSGRGAEKRPAPKRLFL